MHFLRILRFPLYELFVKNIIMSSIILFKIQKVPVLTTYFMVLSLNRCVFTDTHLFEDCVILHVFFINVQTQMRAFLSLTLLSSLFIFSGRNCSRKCLNLRASMATISVHRLCQSSLEMMDNTMSGRD